MSDSGLLCGKIAGAMWKYGTEKAYILGLLHDIGRKFGVRYLGHVSDRYTYMKSFWSMKKRYSLPVFPQRKSSENRFLAKLQENMKQAQSEFRELNKALKDIHSVMKDMNLSICQADITEIIMT